MEIWLQFSPTNELVIFCFMTITLPSAGVTMIPFCAGVFLSGSLKKFKVNKRITAATRIKIIFSGLLCVKKLSDTRTKAITATIPIVE